MCVPARVAAALALVVVRRRVARCRIAWIFSRTGISSPDARRANVASSEASLGSEPASPSSMEARACCSFGLRLITVTAIKPLSAAVYASHYIRPGGRWLQPHVLRLTSLRAGSHRESAADVLPRGRTGPISVLAQFRWPHSLRPTSG